VEQLGQFLVSAGIGPQTWNKLQSENTTRADVVGFLSLPVSFAKKRIRGMRLTTINVEQSYQ
jgi:hypothetical protein